MYFLFLQAWVKSQDTTPCNEVRINILFNVHIVMEFECMKMTETNMLQKKHAVNSFLGSL